MKSGNPVRVVFLFSLIFYIVLAPMALLMLLYDALAVPGENIASLIFGASGYLAIQFLVSLLQRRLKVRFHWSLYLIVPAWSCGVVLVNSQDSESVLREIVFPLCWLLGVLVSTLLGYAFSKRLEYRSSQE